ncbi:c-type cytochrome [Robertkochia marina]|uniref:C-type cytochrome n=1 Tax=Robertkochia marina TaxID=1227945 RepID=A0A4S3M2J5_9FLAO|nr:c-type cytochrome [Robertkochia marina]THD69263.1 c-type cytochrome [Robertkochia marina]TRZ47479.1 heme-binding domain protein [Robertkochia marina]
MKSFLLCLTMVVLLSACRQSVKNAPTDEEKLLTAYIDSTIRVYDSLAVIKLPINNGVKIWNPGVLKTGPEGRIFGANLTGEIYSLEDTDGDGLEDTAKLFCNVSEDGFRTPAGMVFKDWDLYVGLPQQIRVYRDTDHDFVADTSFVFFDKIPYSDHPYEWTSGLNFDEDGWLYCILTTDSWNPGASPDPEKLRGSLLKISPDGKEYEQLATGLRSVHGMDFNAEGELYMVDNQGGQNSGEEFLKYVKGGFYGHNTTKYGEQEEVPTMAYLETEVAPSDLLFHEENGKEELYVSYYGPGEYWERGAIARIHFVEDENGNPTVKEEIITNLPKVSNITFSESGELYASRVGVTDYWYQKTDSLDGAIYKIKKASWVIPDSREGLSMASTDLDANSIEEGRILFNTRACAACHSLDGTTEMLGPDLKNIGLFYNRKELEEEIREPSRRIKPGSFASKITMKNGEVQLGRVITQNEEELQLMLVGNQIKKIPTTEIADTELYPESMMYPGLLDGLTRKEIDALLDFLISNAK